MCDACWSAIRLLSPPLCPACGDPLPSGQLAAGVEESDRSATVSFPVTAPDGPNASQELAGAGRDVRLHGAACPRCRRGSSLITRSRAVGEYVGTLRAIVHVLKYDKRRSVAPRLARAMAASGKEVLCGVDAAIPVPLHWTRKWRRGFNQASLLAAHLGIAVWPALARVRATSPQVALAAPARRANVQNAFALARTRWPWQTAWRRMVEGKTVLLVDDVSTTSATLEACARVLRQAGVREVRALTAARVVGQPW